MKRILPRFFACMCVVLFFLALAPAVDSIGDESFGESPAALADEQRAGVLILPAAIQVIGEEAFEGTAAREVVLPGDVSRIEDRAFAGMENLRAVNIPESVEFIGEDVFAGDEKVTIYGISGGRAEEYARKNNLRFQRTDALLPSGQEELLRIRRLLIAFLLSQALIYIYEVHARFTGRRTSEAKSLRRRERVELHPLDLCFP